MRPQTGNIDAAVVFGGINMDIWGRPEGKLIPKDSNPGTVALRPGGVGRNIAHDLRLLGLEAPAFYHFPLLLGSDGQRLSKRNADAGLDTLGERYTASEILGKLAYLAGFNPSAEPRSGESLLADFAWEKVPRADIRIPEGLF